MAHRILVEQHGVLNSFSIYSHKKRSRYDGLDHDFSFRHKKFRVLLKHCFVSLFFGSLKVREEMRFLVKRYI